MAWYLHHFEDSDQDLFESFKIPVLVDASVNDARVEYLLRFLSKQIKEILHVIQSLVVAKVFFAEVR